ncbi:MAG: hypothetical protein KJ985_03195, partial [Proteobacteria bacterium]|nr:hypothetical protein [Pseudomonadota bacterium]
GLGAGSGETLVEVNGDKPVSFVAWTLINATLLAGDLARPVRATMQNRQTADRWPLGSGVPDDGVTVENSRITQTISV